MGMHIAFIGLGNMGQPMAANILRAGWSCTVHDLRIEAASALLELGATWAETAASAVVGADVVFTMLPGPKQVLSVMIGEGQVLAAMQPGSVWCDLSTSSAEAARQVQAQADLLGISVMEAPVAGMVRGATDGSLQMFAAGPIEVFERVKPLLEVMGDKNRVQYVGVNGAGYAVKLLLNLVWFSHEVVAAEALTMGVRAGVDLGVLHRALTAGPANSTVLEHDILPTLNHGDYDTSFTMGLVCKDLGLATDLARDTGTPAELTALVEQIFRRALATYGPQAGELSAIALYEDLTKTPLRFAAATPEPVPA
jgi:3-hydroxyisobutyrate dehydrogenase